MRRGIGHLIIGGLFALLVAGVLVACQWQGQAAQQTSTPQPDTNEVLASPRATAKSVKPNFLSTAGANIVDAEGHVVRLTGVNWFGLETNTFSPHGLWARKLGEMLDQIAESGFNTIRLPYASTILDPNARPMEGIDYKLNPDLRGLTALQIMDKIVEGAGRRGLKLILDQHRPNTQAQSKLWYTDFFPEAQWIADWQTLAKRYKGNDTVIGADLHNEPAGDAQWGSGDAKFDWRAAAERAGNAILDVNPNWLIIVEGVEKIGNDGYWMGGNLANAGTYPVNLKVPNKLVYSTHDYGPGVYDQQWFHDPTFPANMAQIWDKHWGYLVEQQIAPVLVGEFGGRSVSTKDREGVWQRSLLQYMRDRGISFTYWTFNPNSSDTGGILEDDWQTLNRDKQDLLASNLSPKLAVNTPTIIDHSAVAAADRKNTMPAQPIKVQLAAGNTVQTDELTLKLLIVNQTAANVPLDAVELRYWLSPADTALASLAKPATRNGLQSIKGNLLGIDWASTDGVTLQLVSDQSADRPYLRVNFEKNSGAVPGLGKVEVQVRAARPDKSIFVQSDHYSFKPSTAPVDNAAIGLYFWGSLVWGSEPPPSGASTGGKAGQAGALSADTSSGNGPSGSAPSTDHVASEQVYIVQQGDTLRGIAARTYGSESEWPRIAAANHIEDPDRILVGLALKLPTP